MSTDSHDVALLAAQSLHEIGRCEGPGWCAICDREENEEEGGE